MRINAGKRRGDANISSLELERPVILCNILSRLKLRSVRLGMGRDSVKRTGRCQGFASVIRTGRRRRDQSVIERQRASQFLWAGRPAKSLKRKDCQNAEILGRAIVMRTPLRPKRKQRSDSTNFCEAKQLHMPFYAPKARRILNVPHVSIAENSSKSERVASFAT